jgi:hypothetical protein
MRSEIKKNFTKNKEAIDYEPRRASVDSFKSYDSKGVQKGQKEELLKKINESQLEEKPSFPNIMYFRKPWKTIIITLVTLSSLG